MQNKVQVGIIFNGNNDVIKELLKGDILSNGISDEDVKEFVNPDYYEKFIVDRKDKDDFFTDRESAILFGVPSNLIEAILEAIKKFFRKILQFGNEKTKDETTIEVKDYYDNNDFDMNDVIKISRGTTKQDELFEYVEAPDYLKTRVKDIDELEKDNDKADDFDLNR